MSAMIGFVAGFVSGWAVRSTVDTPRSVGMKALDVIYRTQARIGSWAAVEREHIEDLVAEIRSRYDLPGTMASSRPLSRPDQEAFAGDQGH